MSPKSMIQPVAGSTSPADVDLDAEAVPVQPGALVALRHEREPVRRLERELLEDLRARALSAAACGDVARSREVVEIDRVHTPVASFQAMTCSCGSTRACARSGSAATASQSQRYRSPTASRTSGRRRDRRAGRQEQRKVGYIALRLPSPSPGRASSKHDDLEHDSLARRGQRAAMKRVELRDMRGGRHARTRRLRRDREPIDVREPVAPHASPASRPRRGSPRSCRRIDERPEMVQRGVAAAQRHPLGRPAERRRARATIASPDRRSAVARTTAGSTAYIVSHHEQR